MNKTRERIFFDEYVGSKAIYSTYMARIKKSVPMGEAISPKTAKYISGRNPGRNSLNIKLTHEEKIELEEIEKYRNAMSEKSRECQEIGNPKRLKECIDPYYLQNTKKHA